MNDLQPDTSNCCYQNNLILKRVNKILKHVLTRESSIKSHVKFLMKIYIHILFKKFILKLKKNIEKY